MWTHDAGDRPMARVPAHAAAWLRHWRSSLVRRSDMRPDGRWWSLFRTEGARYERPRVVWPDLARSPRAFVVPSASDVVPLNSCYVARCRDDEDAYALAAVLNSALAAAWLAPLAEPARGGYRRYLAWTMALLPLPRNWAHARLILAPLGRLASSGVEVHAEEMLQAVLESYALPRRAVAPLIAWNGP